MKRQWWLAVWIMIAGCAMDEPAPQERETTAALTTSSEWAVGRVPADGGPGSTSAMSNGNHFSTTHTGTGTYAVQLPGLTLAGGNVLVSPLDTLNGGVHCTVVSWGGGVVNVRCFLPATGAAFDNPFDNAFSLSYARETLAGSATDHIKAAYLWYPGTGTTSSPSYTWTSIGGPGTMVFVNNVSTGVYRVILPGMAATPGLTPPSVAQATAYGSASRYCNASGWRNGGNFAPDRTVDVVCFDAAGNPVNTAFSLRLWTVPTWGAQDGMYAIKTPGSLQQSSTGVSVLCFATPFTTGRCLFNAPGLSPQSSAALTNALETDGKYCNVVSIGGTVGLLTQCYSPSGARADASLSLSYLDGVLGMP